MRRLLLAAALAAALLAPLATPGATAPLGLRLTTSLRSPQLPPGDTAALAVDLETGRVLFAHNESAPLAPASNEKLPVAWAALVRLGPTFRFHTEVLGVGTRTGTTWNGDLLVKGYGDPTLSSQDLDALATAVRAEGIQLVDGRVRGDESFFDTRRDAPGWKPEFVGIESPPLSALVVDRARGWPALSPPLLAARAFRDALARAGVAVTGRPGLGTAPAGALPLATDWSEPLAAIVHTMNADSDNFVAEMVLKELGASGGRTGTSARGSQVVLATLAAAGISTEGLRLADGSGLSRLDRLTAATLVDVLRAGLADQRIRRAFLGSLAVAGRSGTLRDRLLPLRGRLRGKTGTTNIACTLSGVVGRSTVFAVLQGGRPVAKWAARTAQDRFVTILARSLVASR